MVFSDRETVGFSETNAQHGKKDAVHSNLKKTAFFLNGRLSYDNRVTMVVNSSCTSSLRHCKEEYFPTKQSPCQTRRLIRNECPQWRKPVVFLQNRDLLNFLKFIVGAPKHWDGNLLIFNRREFSGIKLDLFR